jgi:hypothetical protein
MPELEIHHEAEHSIDPIGQRVGVMAAILAVALAVVSISSHRTHTAAIIHKSTANDKWSQYQSTRTKFHSIELGEAIAGLVASKNGAAEQLLADYAKQKKKYDKEGKDIMAEARQADETSEADERRALHFDFGEGLLEIALVVTSLYFISHKAMFPVMGLITGIAGAAIAISGLFA